MSGTILKVTTRGTARASNGSAKRLLLRAVHAGGQAADATSCRLGARARPPAAGIIAAHRNAKFSGSPGRPGSSMTALRRE